MYEGKKTGDGPSVRWEKRREEKKIKSRLRVPSSRDGLAQQWTDDWICIRGQMNAYTHTNTRSLSLSHLRHSLSLLLSAHSRAREIILRVPRCVFLVKYKLWILNAISSTHAFRKLVRFCRSHGAQHHFSKQTRISISSPSLAIHSTCSRRTHTTFADRFIHSRALRQY